MKSSHHECGSGGAEQAPLSTNEMALVNERELLKQRKTRSIWLGVFMAVYMIVGGSIMLYIGYRMGYAASERDHAIHIANEESPLR